MHVLDAQTDLNAVSESLSVAVAERDVLSAQQATSADAIAILEKQLSAAQAESQSKIQSLECLLETTEAAAAAGRTESQEHSEARHHELKDYKDRLVQQDTVVKGLQGELDEAMSTVTTLQGVVAQVQAEQSTEIELKTIKLKKSLADVTGTSLDDCFVSKGHSKMLSCLKLLTSESFFLQMNWSQFAMRLPMQSWLLQM
jgi:chromosome segregation ATPase